VGTAGAAGVALIPGERLLLVFKKSSARLIDCNVITRTRIALPVCAGPSSSTKSGSRPSCNHRAPLKRPPAERTIDNLGTDYRFFSSAAGQLTTMFSEAVDWPSGDDGMRNRWPSALMAAPRVLDSKITAGVPAWNEAPG